jgi:HEAT repeat protein
MSDRESRAMSDRESRAMSDRESRAMSDQISRPVTRVDIEADVSGQVAVGDGNVQYRADTLILQQAERRAEAPDDDHLAVYLAQIAERIPPPPEAGDAVQRLWAQPFCARVPGAASVDLYRRVLELFRKDERLGANQRIVVLADTGMGKTPALLYLRLQRAKHSLTYYGRYPTRKAERFVIPLHIRLGDLRTGLPIAALVRDAFNACIPPQAGRPDLTIDQAELLLQQRTCLFLLDDLDELFSEHNRGGIQVLSQFMEAFARHQFIITCRKSSYREQLGSLDQLYLDDLTDAQAREVLGAMRYGQLHPALRDLARNRAMLKIVLDLLDEGQLGALGTDGGVSQPLTRGQLLQRRNRQLVRGGQKTEQDLARFEMEEGLLERLAYAMQRDHTHSYGERQVMEVVRAYLDEWHERYTWREAVIALREKGLLARDERRRWRFCDRATEAYFSAAAVFHEPATLEPILDQVSDLWWRDTLEILVGLLDEPSDLFFELIDRDALVAAQCARSAGQAVSDQVTDALIDALIERMAQENSARRRYIVEQIGASSHPRAPEALLRTLDREWSSVVIMAIARMLWRWDEEGQVLRWIRPEPESAREIFSRYDAQFSTSTEARLIELLHDVAQPLRVRGIAAILLGAVGSDTARGTLLALLMDHEVNEFVGWCAVEALTQIDHPEVRETALKLYQECQGEALACHRAWAVYLLGWVSGRATVGSLLSEALKDGDPHVRGYAAEAMARLDLRHAREQIEALLAVERDPWVLRKAAETLGQIGTVDSIVVLEKHLRHARARTRWMMRWAIAEIRQRHAL